MEQGASGFPAVPGDPGFLSSQAPAYGLPLADGGWRPAFYFSGILPGTTCHFSLSWVLPWPGPSDMKMKWIFTTRQAKRQKDWGVNSTSRPVTLFPNPSSTASAPPWNKKGAESFYLASTHKENNSIISLNNFPRGHSHSVCYVWDNLITTLTGQGNRDGNEGCGGRGDLKEVVQNDSLSFYFFSNCFNMSLFPFSLHLTPSRFPLLASLSLLLFLV